MQKTRRGLNQSAAVKVASYTWHRHTQAYARAYKAQTMHEHGCCAKLTSYTTQWAQKQCHLPQQHLHLQCHAQAVSAQTSAAALCQHSCYAHFKQVVTMQSSSLCEVQRHPRAGIADMLTLSQAPDLTASVKGRRDCQCISLSCSGMYTGDWQGVFRPAWHKVNWPLSGAKVIRTNHLSGKWTAQSCGDVCCMCYGALQAACS